MHPDEHRAASRSACPGPVSCTPAGHRGVARALRDPGRRAARSCILGRGVTLGRPLALLLSQKRPTANAAVTVVHTGVPDWPRYTQRADIVVAAAGVPGILQPEHLTPGRRRGRRRRPLRGPHAAARRRRGVRGGRRLDHAAGRRRRARPPSPCCSATPSRRPSAARLRGASTARTPNRYPPSMTRIADLLRAGPTRSFEFFPPKTDEMERQLDKTVAELAQLAPVVRVASPTARSGRPVSAPATSSSASTTSRRSRAWPISRASATPGPTSHACSTSTPTPASRTSSPSAVTRPADGSDPGGDFEYAIELVEVVRSPSRRVQHRCRRPSRSCIPARPTGPPIVGTWREKLALADFGVTQFFFDADDYPVWSTSSPPSAAQRRCCPASCRSSPCPA